MRPAARHSADDTARAKPSAPFVDASSAEFFDRVYADATDPWHFATSPYELGRYRAILDHVDPHRHRRVFEPGCSIGVLTEQLGRRCPRVDATDISPVAVERARARCAHLPGVTVTVGTLDPPRRERYDLAIISEIGYYHELTDLEDRTLEVTASIPAGGRLIAVHWLGHSADHVLHGDDVHDAIARLVPTWRHVHHHVESDRTFVGYRIDVWDRP